MQNNSFTMNSIIKYIQMKWTKTNHTTK